MKYALQIYSKNENGIFNVGDYVQSIAARQFLPKIDMHLNREQLNKPLPHPVKLIMNGWYMHCPQNWPPSSDIEPLFVSFHINKLAEQEILSTKGIDYLKRHEPIGCRDYYTVSLLKSKGIKAYFSGCLTLTLGKSYQHEERSEKSVYITDLDYTLKTNNLFKIKCTIALLRKYKLLKRIRNRMLDCGIKKSLKSIAALYVTYSPVISDNVLLKAIYKQHEIFDNFACEDAKFKYADDLLKEYSKANFVITTRIHCALPCLAMGTPVVFVTSELMSDVHNCRLDGLKQLFNTITITNSKIESHIPAISQIELNSKITNKKDYIPLADNLVKLCENFTIKE